MNAAMGKVKLPTAQSERPGWCASEQGHGGECPQHRRLGREGARRAGSPPASERPRPLSEALKGPQGVVSSYTERATQGHTHVPVASEREKVCGSVCLLPANTLTTHTPTHP